MIRSEVLLVSISVEFYLTVKESVSSLRLSIHVLCCFPEKIISFQRAKNLMLFCLLKRLVISPNSYQFKWPCTLLKMKMRVLLISAYFWSSFERKRNTAGNRVLFCGRYRSLKPNTADVATQTQQETQANWKLSLIIVC